MILWKKVYIAYILRTHYRLKWKPSEKLWKNIQSPRSKAHCFKKHSCVFQTFYIQYMLMIFHKQIHCLVRYKLLCTLQCRHNERDGVSNHRRRDRLINRLFRRRSKTTSKLRVTGLCEGNSPVTGEFPAQRASNAEIVSIWWRHHVCT